MSEARGAPSVGEAVEARPPNLAEEELRALREAGGAWQRVEPARRPAAREGIDPDLHGVSAKRGAHPGDRRVRRVRQRGFQSVEPGVLQATERASEPTTPFGRLSRRVRRVLVGRPLSSAQSHGERLPKLLALPIISSDALSSVAYGPEAILFTLLAAGSAAYTALIPIAVAIAVLLVALVLSYRQVIKLYPEAGGSYIVAKDNIGANYGLVAGAALVTDYILTVSVSVASGVAAITSAAPEAAPYAVQICVGIIVLIVVANLRGVRESANMFAVPTYVFLASVFSMMAVVFIKAATGTAHYVAPTAPMEQGTSTLGIVLVLRAYSSGCASLTGIEALSNSVSAFRPPAARNARTTLAIMGALLGSMLLTITIAASMLRMRVLDSGDAKYESLLSQLGHVAFGNGLMYFVLQASTALLLALAANTAFTGFPRLFYLMASDGYAPRQLRRLGDRLAYSNGILVLGILAIALVVIFHASTDALLPLYTIGVFLAFTMAQAGMVLRWRRRHEPGWRRGVIVNGVGMVMTAAVFVITGGEKFTRGAWIVIIIMPLLVLLFRAIHGHYSETASLQAVETPLSPGEVRPLCVVPISDLNPVALQSLAFARTISEDVVAVHVIYDQEDNEEALARLRLKWEAWGNHVPLEIIESPYRSLIQPLLRYINELDRQRSDDTIVVVLPELVATRWWHQLLHNQTALRLKAALLFRPGTVVCSVPYHIRPSARPRRRRRGGDGDGLDIS